MKNRILPLLNLLAAVSASTAHTETIGPGTYHGYCAVTRWGQKVFFNGTSHLFVTDAVAAQLEAYKGQPLEVAAAEVSQPINPGGAMIQKIGKVTVKSASEGLVLSASPAASQVTAGTGLTLHLTLTNRSDRAVPIRLETLAVVLVTDSPGTKRPPGFSDPENRAYWYYTEFYSDLVSPNPAKPLIIGCREIPVPWTAEMLIKEGQGIHRTELAPGVAGPPAIEPKGTFAADCILGKELLPGKYEVFFCSASGNLSAVAGPMSARVPFEVVESQAPPSGR